MLVNGRLGERTAVDRAVQPRDPVMRRGPWQRELVWGSTDFEQASALARRNAAGSYPATIAQAAVSHANRRALLAVFRAPVVTVRLCSDEAERLCDFVAPAGRRIFTRRAQLAQFVLDVPATEAEYLAGKSRQALRTNLRHADRAGIKCQRVSCYDDWRVAAEAILCTRTLPAGCSLVDVIGPPDPRHRVALYAATDAYERPVAFAGTAMFGDLACLFTVVSAPDHPGASQALWALNAFVVLDQETDGIRYLTVGSALRDTAGTQYLAHLLGYRVRNLRFVGR